MKKSTKYRIAVTGWSLYLLAMTMVIAIGVFNIESDMAWIPATLYAIAMTMAVYASYSGIKLAGRIYGRD